MFNIVYIIIGILTGALTGFTGGSGMSILMSGLLIFGVNIRSIIGITFFVTLFNSLAALPAYVKNKNISIRDSLIIGVPGAISIFPGYYLSQKINSDYIVWIMILSLFLLGLKFVFANKNIKKIKESTQIYNVKLLIVFGALIGIFIGIFGGGGGIIIGIILITIFKYEIKKAIGISIFVMGLVAISGIILNVKSGKLEIIPILFITIPSVITSYIISHTANKVDPKVIKTILGVYLLTVTIIIFLKKDYFIRNIMINIIKIEIYNIFIPFRFKYGHALKMHNGVSSIICKIYDKSGLVGYGESVPRDYVTGEDCESVIIGLKKLSVNFLHRDIALNQFTKEFIELSKSDIVCFPSCSFCALEGAILDLFGKVQGKSIAKLFSNTDNKTLTYSGSIGMVNTSSIKVISTAYKIMGFKHFKIKVGNDTDINRIKLIKKNFSKQCSFFADANCAWDKEKAIKQVIELNNLGITAIEEPLKPKLSKTYHHGQLNRESVLTDNHYKEYKWLKERSPLPIIADESFISMRSLSQIIEHHSFDILNIRLSKCGGIIIGSEMVRLAKENNIQFSIGAMVAETPILANLGSQFGYINSEHNYIQGYSHKALHRKGFTKGGAKLSIGANLKLDCSLPGIGVEIDDNKLKKLTKNMEIII